MNMEYLFILPILLFSVIIHECAHGYVALKCGDPTARDHGRLTFNPIPHIDMVGSIIMPLLIILTHSPIFLAWAKPVPVNPANFYSPKRDDMLVSIAGPVSNFMLAFVCTILYIILINFFIPTEKTDFSYFLIKMFSSGIYLNVILGVFNLMPFPPLDGSHIIASLLPDELAHKFRSVGFFGIFILLFLLQVPAFKKIFFQIIGIFSYPYEILINLFK